MDAIDLPLSEVRRALGEGRVTSERLTAAALARRRPELEAYICFEPERALRDARAADATLGSGRGQALTGLPASFKDLFGVPGFPVFAGSARELPARFREAGPFVQALLDQGVVVSGKTHMVEFAFGGIGTNPHWPVPVNPWDAATHRVPGGSSSGAAVSVCEGSALFAVGSDTAGSVRIPAAMTGLAGLKTTKGRWSTEGLVPLSPTLDTVGVLARTVADLAQVFAGIDPEGDRIGDVALSDVRLSRASDPLFYDDCSDGVIEALDRALGELDRAGARVDDRSLPEVVPARDLFLRASPVGVELSRFLHSELPQWLGDIDPNVAARIRGAAEVGDDVLQERVQALHALAQAARGRLSGIDALLTPTVAITAPAVAELRAPEHYARSNMLALRNTGVISYLGLCALSIPVGLDAAGIPVGMQLIGAPHGEARLLSIGIALERQLGTMRERVGVAPRLQ